MVKSLLIVEIPGFKKVEAAHLILDYNGTLAIDGKLIEGVLPLLHVLCNSLTIHILTADTFGTSKAEVSEINADIVCNNIVNALELLTNPLRIVSTLRY